MKTIWTFCCLIMITTQSFSQEQKLPEAPKIKRSHRHSPSQPEFNLTVNIPEHEQHSPHTPADIKRLKIKIAAVTAIVTTAITGAVTLYIALRNCK